MSFNAVKGHIPMTYNHTAAAAIAEGDVVVVGGMLGVALNAAAIGEIAVLQIAGEANLPAVNGAAFTAGLGGVWDVSANSGAGYLDDANASPATGDISGAVTVLETVTTSVAGQLVPVLLNQAPGTVN